MLNNQNLILMAISIVSLTSIYLLYTNYQKMQDVAMIREEIVLLKSSLSKMNSYENEIFLKINDRLKQLEEGLVSGGLVSSGKPSLNNKLTEENVEILNQNNQDQPNVVEVSTEGLEPLNLRDEEIQELNDLQNQVREVDNMVSDEMINMSDTEHNDIVVNRVNDLEVNDSTEIEDINLEELDNYESENTDELNDNQVIEDLENVNQSVEEMEELEVGDLEITDLNDENENTTDDKRSLNVDNENIGLNDNINLEGLIREKESNELEEVSSNIEASKTVETSGVVESETKSPLDNFLIESGSDSLNNDFADDLDLDDLEDLNEDENPVSTSKELSENYLNGLTVKELKVISKQKGLKTRGNKKELINIILKINN
jgi:hypothetical protein